MALNRSSLVDIGELLKTVSVTIVLVSVELGASVMVSDGWVSGVMDEVTMLVVEGMTENGVIGADVASVLGLMSTHGVRGELGTMVTVMVSASPGEALRSQRRLSSNIDVSRLGAEPDPEPGGWGGGWKL